MRRSALVAGVTLATLAVGCGDDGEESKPPTSAAPATEMSVRGEPLAEAEVIASANRELTANLKVETAEVEIGGVKMSAGAPTNGPFVPPTLRMEPGDHVRINVENAVDEGTNIHVHGLHVSPISPGDNVLMVIEAGDSYTYEYDLPPDHTPGTYWYHSHAHGISEGQVFGGLSGIIIVAG